MSSTGIEITNVGSVRIITFNNPKTKNALNKNTYAALTQALKEAGVDETVTLVALTGAGSYYSSGNDMIALSVELKDDIDTAREQNLNTMRDFVHALIRFPKLLVAVVNGPCFGIAATTIPLCDVVYASESVRSDMFFLRTMYLLHPIISVLNRLTFIRHSLLWEYAQRLVHHSRLHEF